MSNILNKDLSTHELPSILDLWKKTDLENCIGIDEFVVRIIKPSDPRSKKQDFFEEKMSGVEKWKRLCVEYFQT